MNIIKFNNSILKYDGKWLETDETPTPTPTPLGPYSIRCKFKSGYTPSMGDSQTLVDSTNNIWDIYKESNDWSSLFMPNNYLLEVIDANATNVTDMAAMFGNCTKLTSVALFDTHNVTNMYEMFYGCTSLTSVPLFDTSNVTNTSFMLFDCRSLTTTPLFDTHNVTNMSHMFEECSSLTDIPPLNTSKVTNIGWMFQNCLNVQSGALALYQQASTQTNPPTYHKQTFRNCGSNTQTGSAELAQIPSDWK